MTPQEILQRAIEKAVANGYLDANPAIPPEIVVMYGAQMSLSIGVSSAKVEGRSDYVIFDHYKGLIFDHKFAKAFFGTERMDEYRGLPLISNLELWQFQLREMVLLENPIEYLEQFL